MPEKNLPKNKLLVLVGPTSSGKSELAVKLAKHFNGEIISTDSRQIYKGMDIGTGKVAGKWKTSGYFYKGIWHHLIDYVSPNKNYSAALFQSRAKKTISAVFRRGHLPILCGGTGHWVDAVVFDQKFPNVRPNLKLRKELEKKTAEELFKRLKKLDPSRAKTIDRHNKRRLVRALEIVISTGKPVPALVQKSAYDVLWLGISFPQEQLFSKIKKRLKQRIKQGLFSEVKKLHKQGISWQRLENFGLEYKFGALFWQKKLTREQTELQLLTAIRHYARRQMTWFKRNKAIHWVNSPLEAVNLSKKFLY